MARVQSFRDSSGTGNSIWSGRLASFSATEIVFHSMDSSSFYSVLKGSFRQNARGEITGRAQELHHYYKDTLKVSVTEIDRDAYTLTSLMRNGAGAASYVFSGPDVVHHNYAVHGGYIEGHGGNDRLYGGGGWDDLYGGDGRDQLFGGASPDRLFGGKGADRLFGGDGNDTLDGGLGADHMEGGYGNDANLVDNSKDMIVERAMQGTDKVYASVSFTLGRHLEDLELTGKARINGTGNAADNAITGNAAANRLSGGGGADSLTGGKGADILTGGAGADTFVFGDLADSTVRKAGRDLITDFRPAQGDRIDVSGIDAINHDSRDDAFTFIANRPFSGQAGELRIQRKDGVTTISGDVNGDRIADFAIDIRGMVALTADHFIL